MLCHRINRYAAGAALALAWAGVAVAAPSTAAKPAADKKPATVSATSTATLPAAPAVDSKIAADVALLNGLRRDIDVTSTQVDLLRLQDQKHELSKKIDGDDGVSDNHTPQLVGLYGAAGRMTAEFSVGGSVLQAQAGDYVTAKWRIERVLSNGVVVRDGGKTRTILLGRHEQAPAAAAGMAAAPPISENAGAPVTGSIVYPAPGIAPGSTH